MDRAEIQDIITASQVEDWYRIELDIGELLVLRENVDITIEWGMPVVGSRPRWMPDDWEFEFKLADVQYRDQLVSDYWMIDVKEIDRAVIPSTPGLSHTNFEYQTARLLHGIQYHEDWRAFGSAWNYAR